MQELFTPSLDDRRRLAVTAIVMKAEKQGEVSAIEIGQITLDHVVDPAEVLPLGDAIAKSVARRFRH